MEHIGAMTPAPFASALNPAIDDAAALMRGGWRFLYDRGIVAIPEFILPDGRRADLAGIGPKGEIWILEIKSGVADFRADAKWADYFAWADRFFFLVSERFPASLIPEQTGLIVADAFGAGVVRESPVQTLAPARRKALTLRFARCAAERAMR
jgi:hypothetical protein